MVLASGQVKVGAGVHEIGTANFVLGGASPAKKWGCLGVLLACGQRRRGNARMTLVQRIPCFEVVLAREKGGPHKIGTASLCFRVPLHGEKGVGQGARNWKSEFGGHLL